MLRNSGKLRGYNVGATDGEIGKVSDLYFDDQTWTVRYLVIKTRRWLKDGRVMISPRKVIRLEGRDFIDTSLTLAEVATCPPADCEKPLSDRMEVLYTPRPFLSPAFEPEGQVREGEAHLRSMEEVRGYTLAATDGTIGHVAGFIVDDTDWRVRYLEVDTRDLWPGKHVLLSPEWIEEVSWNESRVRVNLARALIKESPEYDRGSPVTREYEADLCRFYNREGYWTREGCADNEPAAAEPGK